MKKNQKKTTANGIITFVLCTILCGCTQEQTTVTDEVSYGSIGVASDMEAVEILRDISTTQYFTDEDVEQHDVETIVTAGINAPSAMNGQPWHFSVITDTEVLQQISEGMGGGMGFGDPSVEDAAREMTPPEGMMLPEGMEGEMPEDMQMSEDFAPESGMPEEMDFPEGGMPEGMNFPEGERPAAPSGGSGSMNKAGITDASLVIVVSCKAGSELDAGIACQNMSATAQLLGYGTKIVTSPTMALNGANQDAYRELLGIPEDYSAAAILLIGYEDTTVDTNLDGYTGATSRNPVTDMVTYITGDKS